MNNIYVNAVNHGLLDPFVFIDCCEYKKEVNYIHIAGHDTEHLITMQLVKFAV